MIRNDEVLLESCRRDPNPFIEFVMHDQLLGGHQAGLHEDMQDFLTAHDEAGVGMPRGHGKTVQIALRGAWEIGRDPNLRVKTVGVNGMEGAKTATLIRLVIESERYQRVFPNVIPDRDCWGKTAFKVVTAHFLRDATVEACGILGHPGGRSELQIHDDICDLDNAVRHPTMRGQVKEFYHNVWRKMMTGQRQRIWHTWTPWHVDDITAEWKREFSRNDRLFWRPCVGHESPWPEAFPPDRGFPHGGGLIEEEKRNPIAYARAYRLEPLSAEVLVWPAEWLTGAMYTDMPVRENSQNVMLLDFAYTEKTMTGVTGGDPDWSVALIGTVDRMGHAWVRDMIRVQTTYPDFKRRAIGLGMQWNVKRCRAEAVAGQRGLVQQLAEEAPFPVEAVERVDDKVYRASTTQAFVSSGRFHIRCGRDGPVPVPSLEALYNEMVVFPSGSHDDTVDCAMDLIDVAVAQGAGTRVAPRVPNVSPRIMAGDEAARARSLYA